MSGTDDTCVLRARGLRKQYGREEGLVRAVARRSSRDVSAGFLASYAGGYAIWLAYGLSTGSIPLIVVDSAGLLCAGLTLAVVLSFRGSIVRPASWNSRNTTSISPRPAALDLQP